MSDIVTERWYLAGRVQRYATWPTIHKQSVGEHSHAVACIYEHLFGDLEADTERYIRLHDVPELVVGDPPFPIKAQNPDLKAAYDKLEPSAYQRMGLAVPELDPCERNRVKVCDLLEMFLFGIVEVEMGNRLAVPIADRTSEAALKLAEAKLTGDEHRKVVMLVHAELERHAKVMTQRVMQ